MCDARYYAVGDVLGQRVDKKLNVIHYSSKTLDSPDNPQVQGIIVAISNQMIEQ